MTVQEFVQKAKGRLRIHLMQLRRWRMVMKVKAKKRARAAIPEVYTETPETSLIVQSFNHRKNIAGIVAGVRRTSAEELIICEDGSVDGSEAAWAKEMPRPNDFIIRSNDLHEIRTYNRAVSLARGEFIGLLQDDDIPPGDGRWVSDAVRLFRAHQDLAVLGGVAGGCALGASDDDVVYPGGASFQPLDAITSMDPETGIPFKFVDAVWIGPLFFRRDVFLELGGFDLRFSGPGEPGIWLDYDLCLRSWLSGRQVGMYVSSSFRRQVGGQGSVIFSGGKRAENYQRNKAYVERTYGEHIADVHRTIADLNRRLPERGRVGAAL
ncbi:MAG: glycosyltransferase [Thermoleophilia bacterium]